jgi:hypothetical protein
MIKRFWEKWQRVARRIGDFQARLILSVLYFMLIGPFALIVRWGADPLSLKMGAERGWRAKADEDGHSMKRALNQF